jgi:tetratricopeptide (TPR) repeat protein
MKRFLILLLLAPLVTGSTNRTARLRQAIPPGQTLIVGANAVTGGIAEPGWPIIVSAAFGDGKDAPLPANLKVKMTDDNHKEVAVAFERVKDFWIAGESTTKSLKPGRYVVTLTPAGDIQIKAGNLNVEPADDSRADTLGLLKIQRALLTGKTDEALAETERHPKSMDAWIAKGDILMSKDLPDEALNAYDKALELQDPEDEMLALQKRRQAAFFRSLEKRGVIPPAQPVP